MSPSGSTALPRSCWRSRSAAGAIVAWRAVRSPGVGPRLLLVAAVGLAPAALYAASLGLNARNFAGLAVLSAVAVGAGGAWLVASLRQRRTVATSPGLARMATIALVAVAVLAIAGPVVGQRDAGRVAPDRIGDELAGWLAANAPDGGRVVMAFREREQMALRLYGDAEVAILPIARVGADEPPGTYLWMGLRDRQLFGYRRAAWTAAMAGQASGDPADLLVLVGPHPFTPFALTAAPETAIRLGLSPAKIVEVDGDRAEILDVDPAAVGSGAGEVPLHLSAEAAAAWLDLAGGDARSRPVARRATGRRRRRRRHRDPSRSARRGCLLDVGGTGSVGLGPAGTCPD